MKLVTENDKMKSNSWFFDKVTKGNKPLVRHKAEATEETSYYYTELYGQLCSVINCTNTFANLDEGGQFLAKHKLSQFIQYK